MASVLLLLECPSEGTINCFKTLTLKPNCDTIKGYYENYPPRIDISNLYLDVIMEMFNFLRINMTKFFIFKQ
jgi:hypothetical protein